MVALIIYNLPEDNIMSAWLLLRDYGMKIPYERYYELALPGFLFFAIGMYAIPTRVFVPEFKKVSKVTLSNERFLIYVTLLGIFIRLINNFLPGGVPFFFSLLGLIGFAGAFALFASNPRKNYMLAIVVILLELLHGFLIGMYHDALVWLIFFVLFYIYVVKPNLSIKLAVSVGMIFFVLFLQAIKFSYRQEVWYGNKSANLSTIKEVSSTTLESGILLGEVNLISTLHRVNQAWIFASTVDNMDNGKNFQGLTNVNKYLEAVILPRFLAPDKIKSGDRGIFNEFSGHIIEEGTAMGLGIFADGYIAYGAWGVYIFGFALGLIFSLTFKIVERWTKVSPFHVLLLLPLLCYTVRPDCELQTTINHLFKGILLYGFLVFLTRKRFTLDSQEN